MCNEMLGFATTRTILKWFITFGGSDFIIRPYVCPSPNVKMGSSGFTGLRNTEFLQKDGALHPRRLQIPLKIIHEIRNF